MDKRTFAYRFDHENVWMLNITIILWIGFKVYMDGWEAPLHRFAFLFALMIANVWMVRLSQKWYIIIVDQSGLSKISLLGKTTFIPWGQMDSFELSEFMKTCRIQGSDKNLLIKFETKLLQDWKILAGILERMVKNHDKKAQAAG